MELSILIAKILAIMYLAAGIGILTGQISYVKLIDSFKNSPGLTYVAGLFTLIFGMLIVLHHNRWDGDWTALITLIGWIGLIKGVLLIACPQFMLSLNYSYKNTKLWGMLVLALGILFGYLGFTFVT